MDHYKEIVNIYNYCLSLIKYKLQEVEEFQGNPYDTDSERWCNREYHVTLTIYIRYIVIVVE